MVTRKL